MEPILIKKHLRSEYIFYPNLIQRLKKGKVVYEIKLIDIKEITYNEKFGFKDFIMLIVGSISSYNHFPKALVIFQKTKPHMISLKLDKEEIELLKNGFNKYIKLI